MPSKPLKQLILDFYLNDDISEAKDTLLSVCDDLKIDNFPNIARRRRASLTKGNNDLDDIITALLFMDENGARDRLPRFVSTDPDRIPSVRLVEGDFEIIWRKLSSMEELIKEMSMSLTHVTDNVKVKMAAIKQVAIDIKSFKTTYSQRNQAARPVSGLSCTVNTLSNEMSLGVGADCGRQRSTTIKNKTDNNWPSLQAASMGDKCLNDNYGPGQNMAISSVVCGTDSILTQTAGPFYFPLVGTAAERRGNAKRIFLLVMEVAHTGLQTIRLETLLVLLQTKQLGECLIM